MGLTLDRSNLKTVVTDKEMLGLEATVKKTHDDLENKTGKGSDYVGWVTLPNDIPDHLIDELTSLGEDVRSYTDCVISIGIGGSYLGIRSTVEFLRGEAKVPIYYAGHNMCADYMHDLIQKVKDKRVAVVVISKSGTTTEPALAFRVIKRFMESKYSGEELKKRIICVTDAKKGALRQIADKNGYRSYVIPDDVGGRFSVLTPVGLVPLAIAGIDIKALIAGARAGQKQFAQMDLNANPCYQYAASRFLLYKKGKVIEVLASFYDNMFYVNEWWKQLFGESEGKDGKGIFPASLILSTDLHSMGQLMQDGMRNVFETFVEIEKTQYSMVVPKDPEDLDKFNIVAGKDLDYVNKTAAQATADAHAEGGAPNMKIMIEKADAFHLGLLYYFFERAVGVSGYLLEVNPFDQPGVEAYKKKMFALLGKA